MYTTKTSPWHMLTTTAFIVMAAAHLLVAPLGGSAFAGMGGGHGGGMGSSGAHGGVGGSGGRDGGLGGSGSHDVMNSSGGMGGSSQMSTMPMDGPHTGQHTGDHAGPHAGQMTPPAGQ